MVLSIKAEPLFEIASTTVTNSLMSGVIVAFLLIIFFTYYGNKLKLVPTKFQLFIEWVVESIQNLCVNVLGKSNAENLFPIIFTFFTFIIVSNWFGLLPFVGSIGVAKHSKEEGGFHIPTIVLGRENKFVDIDSNTEIKPYFRSPSADLNFTIALAIISFILIQFFALKKAGLKYLAKYFDYRINIGKGVVVLVAPFMFLINFFWKTLELVLEFSKILSFSFRLFGNIFAGEVLLLVITSLTFGLLTLPFIAFEIFVGFIQAIVFIFLTMVFIKVSIETH